MGTTTTTTTRSQLANRIGFIVLGLTNNFAYVIMLSAAYDLLKQPAGSQEHLVPQPPQDSSSGGNQLLGTLDHSSTSAVQINANSQLLEATNQVTTVAKERYCNEHPTATILIADTLPSLATKIIYPFALVGLPTGCKATATAILAAAAFIITGLSANRAIIFMGVACASFSSGLGESVYVSSTHLYGDVSLAGWSIGTGCAGLVGASAYALLRMLLPIRIIMFTMLLIPIAMLYAFFCVIKPVTETTEEEQAAAAAATKLESIRDSKPPPTGSQAEGNAGGAAHQLDRFSRSCLDGAHAMTISSVTIDHDGRKPIVAAAAGADTDQQQQQQPFGWRAKLKCLPSLAKYFMPLLLVYFAEYFINQGLFELVYYPEVTFLDHAAQYRWFQVSYQLGVMISRSSLDFFQIKNIWTMSLLQAANALLFLAHAARLIHVPSFYIVIALIIYEGLLGGFTYVNCFYRIKKEVSKESQEFCMSTVTIADSLGIVMAGLAAMPVHDALCKLYD